jgi:hypothetical protein
MTTETIAAIVMFVFILTIVGIVLDLCFRDD